MTLLSQSWHPGVTALVVAWGAWFVDLILPRRCVSCGSVADTLCALCTGRLRVLRPPWCNRCGAPTAWPVERCLECDGRRLAFASARSAVIYAGPARPLVHAWKERGLRHIAALAAELVAEHVPCPAADVIAYIPPDEGRQRARGHHPAERLARELGRGWGLEALPLLRRAGPAARQAGLSRAERRQNARGAFTATAAVPRRVLLVDDVYTTGATAAAAASVLRSAGATHVDVVTFARTVR